MTALTVQPIYLNDVTLSVADTEYEASVTKVQLDPTTPLVRWRGMSPGSSHAFHGEPEWVAGLTYAQDWTTPGSLSAYLLEHVGEVVPCTFEPKKGGVAVRVDLLIAPGAIGGDLDTVAQASVSLAVQGQPVLVPPAAD